MLDLAAIRERWLLPDDLSTRPRTREWTATDDVADLVAEVEELRGELADRPEPTPRRADMEAAARWLSGMAADYRAAGDEPMAAAFEAQAATMRRKA
jgi:hypothetical protein